MRIWYQSFTDPNVHGAYIERLSAHLDGIGGEGSEFRIGGIKPSGAAVHRITEMRCALQALNLGVAAKSDGFDAVLLGHGLVATFRREAQRLVDAGAGVIIPAGGLFGLLSAGERDFRVGDAVVLDPIAASVRATAVAVWMQRNDGTTVSRAGAYAKPPQLELDQISAHA